MLKLYEIKPYPFWNYRVEFLENLDQLASELNGK